MCDRIISSWGKLLRANYNNKGILLTFEKREMKFSGGIMSKRKMKYYFCHEKQYCFILASSEKEAKKLFLLAVNGDGKKVKYGVNITPVKLNYRTLCECSSQPNLLSFRDLQMKGFFGMKEKKFFSQFKDYQHISDVGITYANKKIQEDKWLKI